MLANLKMELGKITIELLPGLYESKDWQRGSDAERIMWLKGMYESRTREVDIWVEQCNLWRDDFEKSRANFRKEIQMITRS